jgi:positive regulator of sigma E activity
VLSPRRIASTLDTALLVFFVLVLLAVGWWLVKALLGTVLFFGKLAILALLVALAIRGYLWARSRLRRPA